MKRKVEIYIEATKTELEEIKNEICTNCYCENCSSCQIDKFLDKIVGRDYLYDD